MVYDGHITRPRFPHHCNAAIPPVAVVAGGTEPPVEASTSSPLAPCRRRLAAAACACALAAAAAEVSVAAARWRRRPALRARRRSHLAGRGPASYPPAMAAAEHNLVQHLVPEVSEAARVPPRTSWPHWGCNQSSTTATKERASAQSSTQMHGSATRRVIAVVQVQRVAALPPLVRALYVPAPTFALAIGAASMAHERAAVRRERVPVVHAQAPRPSALPTARALARSTALLASPPNSLKLSMAAAARGTSPLPHSAASSVLPGSSPPPDTHNLGTPRRPDRRLACGRARHRLLSR